LDNENSEDWKVDIEIPSERKHREEAQLDDETKENEPPVH
jgi:hypothetical protein